MDCILKVLGLLEKQKQTLNKEKKKKQKNKSVIKVYYVDISFDKNWDCSVVCGKGSKDDAVV